ncbi:MAG: SsrA-binding protein SmpB [Acidobacteriota bacterium]
MSDRPFSRQLASNRRAFHEYHIHDRVEAGIALTGTEVKAARMAKVQLRDGFVEFYDGQAWLAGVHIGHYSHGNRENHEPERKRKLLLHKREIDKFAGRSQAKGYSVVPLAMYLKGNHIKVEIALAQGKKLFDKRQAARERELDREAREAIKAGRRAAAFE